MEADVKIRRSEHTPGPARRLSRRRRLLFIFAVLLGLAIVQEVACRWMFPVPEVRGFNRINYSPLDVFHTDLFKARRKGLSNVKLRWECEPDGFAFEHTLNLYGFRGPDFAIEPDPTRPRVLFVGDSYVEGCGVADEDTLPKQFTQVLSARQPIEAVNLGVLAIGFSEYLKIIRDSVPLLCPQTVFLVVCWNDLPAPPLGRESVEPAPPFARLHPWMPRIVQLGNLLSDGVSVPRRWPSGPFPYFEAVPAASNPLSRGNPPRAIEPSILRAMQQGKANPWLWTTADMNRQVLLTDFPRNGGVAAHLSHLASLCQEHATQLVLVYIPYHVATNDAYAEVQEKVLGAQPDALRALVRQACELQRRHLAETTRLLKLPFLDTTSEFLQAEKAGSRLFWPVDGHCNAAGYRLIAGSCARYWIDHTLPPTIDPEP